MSSLTEKMSGAAREAQVFSRKHLVLELDYSAESIAEIERSVDTLDFAIAGGASPENVDMITSLWGAYLGEVIRQKIGGDWVLDENGDPCLRCERSTVSPHEQVRQRLTHGTDYDLLGYFERMTETS